MPHQVRAAPHRGAVVEHHALPIQRIASRWSSTPAASARDDIMKIGSRETQGYKSSTSCYTIDTAPEGRRRHLWRCRAEAGLHKRTQINAANPRVSFFWDIAKSARESRTGSQRTFAFRMKNTGTNPLRDIVEQCPESAKDLEHNEYDQTKPNHPAIPGISRSVTRTRRSIELSALYRHHVDRVQGLSLKGPLLGLSDRPPSPK